MKHLFSKVAAIGAVLTVLVAALAVGIIHSTSTHASTAAAFSESCPPTESQGASNTWVQVIQFEINAFRSVNPSPHFLATDGVFGPATRSAVVAYQNAMHISGGNGVVGTRTWASMGFCLGFKTSLEFSPSQAHCPATLRNGSSGVLVQALQRKLNIYGNGNIIAKTFGTTHWWPLKVDGSFGANTVAAVKSLQIEGRSTQDGIVGSTTWHGLAMCY